MKGAVLLAGAGAGGLDDLQEQVHGLLQHLLPLLAGGVQQGLRGRHRRHKVLENVELDPGGEKGVNFRRLLYYVKYICNFYNKKIDEKTEFEHRKGQRRILHNADR